MSGSDSSVTVVITITIVPIGSMLLPSISLIAIAGTAAGILIAAALTGMAIICWSRCLVLAAQERDYGWIRDLVFVPAIAAWAAVALSAGVANWSESFPHSDLITHLKTVIPQHGPIVILPIILGPLAAYVWFRALISTPGLLAKREPFRRLLAYPAFAIYAIWITVIILTWKS